MEPAVRDNVRVEQMRMLFETPLPGMLLATSFACALAWQMRGTVPDANLAWWVVVKCLVVLPRVAHALLFARRRSDSLAWLDWGIALLLLDGLAWGSAGVVMMVPGDRSAMAEIAASLSGVAAIATFAVHADWRASVAFTGAALLPTVIYFVSLGDAFGAYGAVYILVFLALLLAAARRSERHVVELLALRFRNAKLAEQLTSALARTEQESHAKDVFVANMSHELRTPLHGILGLSRTLARNLAPKERETLALIRRSGEHLLGLINNILEFSRFKAHGIDVHPTEVELQRVIEDAVALCTPHAQERELSLSTEILLPSSYPTIVDPLRLRQILLNLLGNAIKFTDAGGAVQLRVCERHGRDGIQIEVRDSGIGMTPQAIALLFEPFRQGDSSPSRRHGGTGLGLHITREICRKMGGDVRCRSELGRGSVFEVQLPLARVAASAPRPAPAPAGDSGFSTELFGGGTVLLAEDNEVNAIVAEAALHRLGLKVDLVSSGLDVVERLRAPGDRPDIVLLDCQMPEMDGYEACRQVRAYERQNGLDRIPIVALTANVLPHDRERCRDAGMDAFLGKPFTELELQQVLASFALAAPATAESSLAEGVDYAARL